MKRATLEALHSARAERQAVVLITDIASGEQRIVREGEPVEGAELAAAVLEALAREAPQRLTTKQGDTFVQPFLPPLRLIVVGGVHIAQELVPFAERAGYRVAVVDPRGDFASPARFPEAELHVGEPGAAIEGLAPDTRTAVVTLTHLPDVDDPALGAALRSRAFYIGSLGSTRTHALRLERLGAAGFSAEQLARIHGPVGLAIGARTPAEIAVSILAEMTSVLRGAGT